MFGSEIYDAFKLASGAKTGQFYGVQVPAVETVNDIANAIISDCKWVKSTVEAFKGGKLTKERFAEELTKRVLDTFVKTAQPFTGIPIKNAKDVISGAVHSVTDVINGEAFTYEAATKNNVFNRVTDSEVRKPKQYYRILANAIIEDDTEKYRETIKKLLDSETPDKKTIGGIKTALKESDAVITEADRELEGVEGLDVYKGLSGAGKDDVEKSIRDAIAKEKIIQLKKEESEKFSELYRLSRLKNKSEYNKLRTELLDGGLSDSEIDIALEVEKFRILEKQGITVAEWFTAKKAISEANAKKNAEIYRAIEKTDFSAADKKALWSNMK